MIILALDLATETGIAIGGPGQKPFCTTVDLGKRLSDAERFSRAFRMVGFFVKKYQPRAIAIEGVVGGVNRSDFLTGLVACVKCAAFLQGIPVEGHNIGAVRSHFIGRHITSSAAEFRHIPAKKRKAAARGAAKAAVMAKCRMLGWTVLDDNQGDAAALLDFALSMRSRSHQVTTIGGLFRENSGE